MGVSTLLRISVWVPGKACWGTSSWFLGQVPLIGGNQSPTAPPPPSRRRPLAVTLSAASMATVVLTPPTGRHPLFFFVLWNPSVDDTPG